MQLAMRQDAMTKFPALSLLILLLIGVPSAALGNEPIIQADVYNALYEAYVQCDDNFDQSRSEFITEKLELGSGDEITEEVLRKILNHNVQIANESLAEKMRERERYMSEILGSSEESADPPADTGEEHKDPYKEVRQIDDFLKAKRQYVEVHECVLRVL